MCVGCECNNQIGGLDTNNTVIDRVSQRIKRQGMDCDIDEPALITLHKQDCSMGCPLWKEEEERTHRKRRVLSLRFLAFHIAKRDTGNEHFGKISLLVRKRRVFGPTLVYT